MDAIIFISAAPLFLLSLSAHIYVKLKMRPDPEDLEDYYHEVEHLNPKLQKYEKWSKITFTATIIATLLLFLTIAI